MSGGANDSLRVLLIEDNPQHAELIQRHLARVRECVLDVAWAQRLSEGIDKLENDGPHVVLLDLRLPDSDIDRTLATLLNRVPHVPIVVLTSLNDMQIATTALQGGAQDFLVKSNLNADSLYRAIRYAIERKRTQRELERYAANLERSNQGLRQFAHTIAHEVRSPLSVVMMLCEILERKFDTVLDAKTLEFIHSTKKSVGGLGELVDELLSFSEAGSEQTPLEPTDTEQVLYDALAGLRTAIADAQAVVTNGPLPTVPGRGVQLRQLLQNLIGNAIKYRGPESPRVHVAAEAKGDVWQFSVSDNGIGIEAGDVHRLFKMFERIHAPDASEIPGTGIGLAFCKRIVEHHGGRIWVESTKHKGSVFHFTLPAADSAESQTLQSRADILGDAFLTADPLWSGE